MKNKKPKPPLSAKPTRQTEEWNICLMSSICYTGQISLSRRASPARLQGDKALPPPSPVPECTPLGLLFSVKRHHVKIARRNFWSNTYADAFGLIVHKWLRTEKKVEDVALSSASDPSQNAIQTPVFCHSDCSEALGNWFCNKVLNIPSYVCIDAQAHIHKYASQIIFYSMFNVEKCLTSKVTNFLQVKKNKTKQNECHINRLSNSHSKHTYLPFYQLSWCGQQTVVRF